jgi:hypothetical protein
MRIPFHRSGKMYSTSVSGSKAAFVMAETVPVVVAAADTIVYVVLMADILQRVTIDS